MRENIFEKSAGRIVFHDTNGYGNIIKYIPENKVIEVELIDITDDGIFPIEDHPYVYYNIYNLHVALTDLTEEDLTKRFTNSEENKEQLIEG